MEKISSRISDGAIFAAEGDVLGLHFERCRLCDIYPAPDLSETEGIDLVELRLGCMIDAFVDI
jgi:hypothetical protein